MFLEDVASSPPFSTSMCTLPCVNSFLVSLLGFQWGLLLGAFAKTMLPHDRYPSQQTYGGYDEYEEDEVDEEGDEEENNQEQEDEEPTQEVMEFLKEREKYKEKIRHKLKKENAAALGSTRSLAKSGATTDTKFGSFFGPSQRVIAPRVIKESQSIREAKHIVSKAPNSNSSFKPVSSKTVMKSFSSGKPVKVVNEVKRKVQTLKETRDYSFLLSDDADVPNAEPALKNTSAPNSGSQSGRSLPPPKMSTSKPGKPTQHSQLSKNSISRDPYMQKKPEYQKTVTPSRPKSSSSEPRKLLEAKGHGGVSQPLASKASSQAAKQATITRQAPATQVTVTRQPPATQVTVTRQVPATQVTVTRQVPASGTRKPSNVERAPLLAKTHSTAQNKISHQKKEIQDASKGKVLTKQAISSSKPQLSKPSKQIPQRSTHEERPKQKPLKRYSRNPFDDDDDDIDASNALAFLRNKMLAGYHSRRHQYDDDDDCSDMEEANFDDIMEEEERSLQIARREDEEQLRLIEEEEMRERMRREAKRRKLMRR